MFDSFWRPSRGRRQWRLHGVASILIFFSTLAGAIQKSAPFTVVIASGMWHPPVFYGPLRQVLSSYGIQSACPLYPTLNITNASVTHISDPIYQELPQKSWPTSNNDADAIREVTERMVADGRIVLMVAHSYGGWVVSQAITPELQHSARKRQGLKGGVIGILAVSAFLVPLGLSPSDLSGPDGPPFAVRHVSHRISRARWCFARSSCLRELKQRLTDAYDPCRLEAERAYLLPFT